ncbi:MAG: tRNA (adenosine(37)-N6)-threonylcarbamoyltransferase complex ATPase subunit type 1 TsaE [Sediminispirochaetaceae bacterium]
MFNSVSSEQTVSLGEKLGLQLQPGAIVSLTGPLGSGKTTLVKGIARTLKIKEEITSPSFTLISEYRGSLPLYHMDLYRIDSFDEFELTGAEELMYGRGVTVIEWAEKIGDFLPTDTITVVFKLKENLERTVTIEGIEELN